MKILFMCVANSARSQLAEGLAKSFLGPDHEIQSAGSNPGNVNPLAIQVMNEIDINISDQYSKSVDDLDPKFIVGIDYIVTLCAEEVCPTMVAPRAKRLHWPLTDPAGNSNLTNEEKLKLFRQVREAIKFKIVSFKSDLGI